MEYNNVEDLLPPKIAAENTGEKSRLSDFVIVFSPSFGYRTGHYDYELNGWFDYNNVLIGNVVSWSFFKKIYK